jgi:signal transduction histidine kinase
MIEHALRRMYQRLGSRIIGVLIVNIVLLVTATGALSAVAIGRYLGFSVAQTWRLSVWVPIIVACSVTGLGFSIDQIRTILNWSREKSTPDHAEAVWIAVVRLPMVATRAALVGCIGMSAMVVDLVVEFHQPAWVVAPILVAAPIPILASWVLVVFTIELAMRPMLEDVAASLPSDFRPSQHGLRFRTRSFAPLLVVTAFGVMIVGAFANLTGNGALRLAITVGIAYATLAMAGVIFAIVTRSFLDPVGEVIAAAERVRRGDLSRPVPVISGDELGALAHGFNEMLDKLREREALQAELQASRERIVAAADDERRRIERDIHDGAQQQLVVMNLKLGMVARTVESDPVAAASAIEEVRRDVERALAELRDLAHGLYPQLLESEGLPGALREAVERAAIPATLECDGAGRYRAELEAAVYFCCLEALQNAAKHAGPAARATVRLAHSDHALRFEVADDGPGHGGPLNGTGIQNMTDRIGALGGELMVESAAGRGTTVKGAIPI